MKIAYIVPSLINKGPVILVNTLINNLVKKGIDIDVYYFKEEKGLVFSCPTYKIEFDQAIDFDKYDIIHSHMFRPDRYVCKWKTKIRSAKTFSTIHQDIFAGLKSDYGFIFAYLVSSYWIYKLNKFDNVIAISEKIKSLFSSNIKKIERIYNGVDIEIQEDSIEESVLTKVNELRSRGLKILGTYASLTKGKGQDQILRAIEENKELAFVIIGEGNNKENLQSQVKNKKLEERVVFFPYLKSPYNYCFLFDAYVMSSRSEGFGLAVIEAMMTKTPVVCSKIDVFVELFKENLVSFFELDNTESILKAIDSALNKSKISIEAAYTHCVTNFNGKIMADNYLEAYNIAILNKKNS